MTDKSMEAISRREATAFAGMSLQYALGAQLQMINTIVKELVASGALSPAAAAKLIEGAARGAESLDGTSGAGRTSDLKIMVVDRLHDHAKALRGVARKFSVQEKS